jgi:hypothetical protein
MQPTPLTTLSDDAAIELEDGAALHHDDNAQPIAVSDVVQLASSSIWYQHSSSISFVRDFPSNRTG